jgi:hypothetical protein
MAVSSSIDFSITATQLLQDARAELGVYAAEEPYDAVELADGLRFLTGMLKAWQADGLSVMVWTLTEGSLTLVASDESYTVQSGGDITTVPMDIVQARITRNSVDTEMTKMTREEYYAIPNKTSTGFPLNYYYDRQRETGVLKVWPAPDSTAGTFKYTYRRRVMDVDTGAENIDMPQEWYEAMRLNLAERLVGYYGKAGTPEGQRVGQKAPQAYSLVKSYDQSEGDVSIWITPGGHRRR